ncbi:MAG: hypothetical protein IOC49_11105 [Methylobacterium sp.]|nr:hypothetical protein [Methylobacterium sp.]
MRHLVNGDLPEGIQRFPDLLELGDFGETVTGEVSAESLLQLVAVIETYEIIQSVRRLENHNPAAQQAKLSLVPRLDDIEKIIPGRILAKLREQLEVNSLVFCEIKSKKHSAPGFGAV